MKSAVLERKKELDPVRIFGSNKVAIELFESLERDDGRVGDVLLRKFLGLPVNPGLEEYAFRYFIAHSIITSATVSNRGGSMTTEFLYDGLFLSSDIDRYLLNCKSGKAVKARLIAIERNLPKIIEHYQKKVPNVLIGNLGSGPGGDVIDVLARDGITNVRAIHLDKDEKALERGKRVAEDKGVAGLIEFVKGDFMRYNPPEKFDIILLIGILCPLSIEHSILVLKTIKGMLKKGGYILVSNSTSRMKKEDPFTCFIMEWTSDWRLVYKDEPEMKKIIREAGLTWEGCFFDSYGFHIMGLGSLS